MQLAELSVSQKDSCDICGAAKFEPWLEVTLGGIFDRWIACCGSCGFRQVRPRLTSVELEQLYPAEYFDASRSIGYGEYAREAQRRARDAYFLAKRLRRRGLAPRVLEVGCALGFLLSPLRDAGLDVQGVDASPFAAYFARTRFRLSIHTGTLERVRFPEESFDMVVQKDLLEHVTHPRQHMIETHRVMRAGAELWLVTPCGEANLRPLSALRRATFGGDSDLPLLDQGHLSFFSHTHLQRLFDETGFIVKRSRAIGIRRGLRALGRLPGQHRFARLATRAGVATQNKQASSDSDDDKRFRERAKLIDAAISNHYSQVRGWKPYVYWHRFLKLLDALPASTGLGYDFEFLLRKK